MDTEVETIEDILVVWSVKTWVKISFVAVGIGAIIGHFQSSDVIIGHFQCLDVIIGHF